jgi:hypothetical protein
MFVSFGNFTFPFFLTPSAHVKFRKLFFVRLQLTKDMPSINLKKKSFLKLSKDKKIDVHSFAYQENIHMRLRK